MAGEHEDGAVSRRRFLKASAVAAAALAASASWEHGSPRAAGAAGPLSPLQPPPDELLITIRQLNSSGTIDVNALTSVLGAILYPIGWTPQALRVIVIRGRVPGGPSTVYTVIRYHTPPSTGVSVVLAAGTILDQRARVQTHLPSGATLVSVTPNWAIAAAPGFFIQGGPGGLPDADVACGKGWHCDFPTLSASSQLLIAPSGATVVVLDTMPAPNTLSRASKQFPGNTLLGEVATRLSAPGHTYNAVGPSPRLPHARHVPCGSSTPDSAYAMADHGLFVSGIVHDIAPSCDLRIIRVLNAWGAAYLSDLLAGLAQVPTIGPLVVNMSLTLRMPSIGEWHAQLRNSHYSVITALQQEWPTLQDACAPLGLILQLLAANNVFLVAASGNDSGSGPLRDPCAPAAFDSTLGVAAVNQMNQRSCYSNRGDDETAEGDSVANGIATLGGDPASPMHGLYSAPTIERPPKNTGPPNQDGWAQWMGTSFATPVIAALAANYLANNPSASPAAVIGKLRAAGTVTDPSLKAPTITVRQVCA
jgi:Subtilase family/TAT (twin-arginine translocation) pathway signal sequence